MKAFAELAPWTVHSLGASPFDKFWCFNPSIVRTPDSDGGRWLCSIRCANYHLPGSVSQPNRQVGPIRNRNLIVELDPATWQVKSLIEILDRRIVKQDPWAKALGFEDLRLTWTGDRGLVATGCAMQLETSTIEMIVLGLDDGYQIVDAAPLRWVGHQKNWAPFADCDSLRLLYSPLAGGVHDRRGRIVPTHDPVSIGSQPTIGHRPATGPASPMHLLNGAMEIKISSGMSSRALAMAGVATGPTRLALRGSTQLVQVAPGQWLSLAHGRRIDGGKFYWHQAMLHDYDGNLLAASEPFKLSPAHGIEFAAGLALDPATGRLVISFGIEDDTAWLGVTELGAVLSLLRPMQAPRVDDQSGARTVTA